MSSATRPLVFLVPAQFTDRWMWTPLVARLAPVADVEHVEPMRVELPAYEDGIRARIERASTARPVCVAGASLGAYVAARIAATTSAVAHLFAFSGLARLPEEANTSRLETARALEDGTLALRDVARALAASVLASSEAREPEIDRVLERELAALGRDEVVWGLRATAPLADDTWRVSRLETPATIVHGTRDQAVAFALGEELAAAAPNGRLTALDTSSHLLPLTHDADAAQAMHATLARLTT